MVYRGELMANWRKLCMFAVILAALAGLAVVAHADFKPKVSSIASGAVGSVIINGETAVRFQVSNGNLSGPERAKITADRIAALVNAGFNPSIISVKGDANAGRIYAAETLICIATAADAKALKSKPLDLAAKWASQIRTLLMLPAVVLSPAELTVPFEENRQVEIKGAAAGGPVSLAIDDPEIADVAVQSDGKKLTILGKKLGKAVVEVEISGERATMVILVKKYAGSVPSTVAGQVTGNPCPAQLVTYAARQAIAQSARLEQGATIEVDKIEGSNEALGTGKGRQMKANVKIRGGDYIPVATTVDVDVRNVVLPREAPIQLFYSNNPESIYKYQPLFAGRVDINAVTRLLYHHQSEMSKKTQIIVELVNPNDIPAQMRIFRGISPPLVDTIYVGHVATNAFMRDYANDVSVIEVIPPQSRLVLVSDILSTKQTSSGIIEVKQMVGLPTFVRVTAAEPGVDNVSRGTIARAPNPFIMQLSDHIYPTPIKTVDAEYEVGSRWAFISIGKHALSDSSEQKKLYGNYGVTYNINVRVHNPTEAAKKISLVFDPTAGPCSAVFIVNGKFVPVKYAQPPNEVVLDSIMLEPGQTKMCKVTTIPLAGSNYPAMLVVRS